MHFNISNILKSKGMGKANKLIGFSDTYLLNYYKDIVHLQMVWEEQGFIETIDSNHTGYRAYGIAKNSNKYPPEYEGLFHVRIKNNDIDPILIIRIEEDKYNPNYHVIKIVMLTTHAKMFGNSNNILGRKIISKIIKETEEY